MDVTTEDRAHLEGTLTDRLGAEATRIMMAHLPEGGAATLATKQDLSDLGDELRAEIRQCATKEDLERFATKEDVTAIRADIREMNARFDARDAHFRAVQEDIRELRAGFERAMDNLGRIRAEAKADVLHYVNRNSLIQIGATLAIILAALGIAFGIGSGATP